MMKNTIKSNIYLKKIFRNIINFLFALSTIFSSVALADFLPIGPFWGISDSTITMKRVDGIIAMEDKEGNRYNLPESYKYVSDFSNGVCTIIVRSNESGGNFLGILANHVFQKAFYLREDKGELVRVDIDFLKFHCKKF